MVAHSGGNANSRASQSAEGSHFVRIRLFAIPPSRPDRSQTINHSISALATLKGPHLIEDIQDFNRWRYPYIKTGIDLDQHLFMESMIWTFNFDQGGPCCLRA